MGKGVDVQNSEVRLLRRYCMVYSKIEPSVSVHPKEAFQVTDSITPARGNLFSQCQTTPSVLVSVVMVL